HTRAPRGAPRDPIPRDLAHPTGVGHAHRQPRRPARRSPHPMNAYLDTSVLLRLVLGEPAALDDLSTYEHLVSSELIAVESHRTIDRLRLQGALTVDAAIASLDRVTEWLQSVDQVLLRAPVL